MVKQRLGLTSRYVCQRLQQLTESIYGEYAAKYGGEIASQVLAALLAVAEPKWTSPDSVDTGGPSSERRRFNNSRPWFTYSSMAKRRSIGAAAYTHCMS